MEDIERKIMIAWAEILRAEGLITEIERQKLLKKLSKK